VSSRPPRWISLQSTSQLEVDRPLRTAAPYPVSFIARAKSVRTTEGGENTPNSAQIHRRHNKPHQQCHNRQPAGASASEPPAQQTTLLNCRTEPPKSLEMLHLLPTSSRTVAAVSNQHAPCAKGPLASLSMRPNASTFRLQHTARKRQGQSHMPVRSSRLNSRRPPTASKPDPMTRAKLGRNERVRHDGRQLTTSPSTAILTKLT